eukprot:jgi/Bigna1/143560/aug1.79_g18268
MFTLVFGGVLAACYVTAVLVRTNDRDKWGWIEENVEKYGPFGVVLTSAAPIVLHPVILFAMLASFRIFLIPLGSLWWVLKYSIMAQCALTAPGMLRYFGGKKLVDVAKKES